MTRHTAFRTAALALLAMVAACRSSSTEPGESGVRWNADQTATDTRRGVDLVISYDASGRRFNGTVTNTTGATVTDVRVEIHLSNGTELGPTPRVDLAAGAKQSVTLDAAGQNFDWYSVHVELGSSSG
ncbi:MAG: hypothetical protein F4179_02305 [Gammaproteobacteria bacterium]|nr:hypothetical protein [Gammaproteobacteria bacterium]MYC99027.1 hypothetical protein [Gammaproteobacteria bacterium]MYF60501.1 hypothetical protein [Gammaproteobacteria bacterium]MYI21814.1 hypothetical protein [Gammaproteobacteria bacterium]